MCHNSIKFKILQDLNKSWMHMQKAQNIGMEVLNTQILFLFNNETCIIHSAKDTDIGFCKDSFTSIIKK